MHILGILGGVAGGKSLVARQLEALGAGRIDADELGHEVLREPDVRQAAKERWGEGVLGPDGQIDRRRLAEIVFAAGPDAEREREYLERLTHPEIERRFDCQLKAMAAEGRRAVVLDAALLVDAGWDIYCDTLVFVDSPRALRLERARQRGWSEEDFSAREEAQKSLDFKRRRADVVIDDSGSPETTRAQIEHLWRSLIG